MNETRDTSIGIRIEVNQEDIAKAKEKRAYRGCNSELHCPIAQALIRIGHSEVKAGYDVISTGSVKLVTPDVAKEFMDSWDNMLPVNPISFFCKEIEYVKVEW